MTPRVLVVDDEPDVEPLFRQQFRREVRDGLCRLDFARSGVDALAQLDLEGSQEIALVVSDINMPGMSGLDLLPVLKSRRPELPVFMISAYADDATARTAAQRGAARFMPKPIDFQALRREVSRIVDGP